MTDRQANIIVALKDQATKGFKRLSAGLKSLNTGFRNVAKIGIPALAAGLGFAVKAADDQTRALKQMDAVLESTGHAAQLTKKEITDYSSALQDQIGVSDEVIQSGQNILLTFTNIKKDAFNDTTKTLIDMTAALNDGKVSQELLKTQAIQLGKALNDPVKGISALTRVGVTFTDAQKDQIKTLQNSGDTLGAQQLILKELNKEFGGSAKAARDTFGGAMKAANAIVGDTAENIGFGLSGALQDNLGPALVEGAKKLKEFLNVERIAGWVKNFQTAFALLKLGFKSLSIGADKALNIIADTIVDLGNKIDTWKNSLVLAYLKIKGLISDTKKEQSELMREMAVDAANEADIRENRINRDIELEEKLKKAVIDARQEIVDADLTQKETLRKTNELYTGNVIEQSRKVKEAIIQDELDIAAAKKLIEEEEAAAKKLKEEEEAAAKKKKAEEELQFEELQKQSLLAIQETFDSLQVLAIKSKSRELFDIAKTGAVAAATVNTYQGVTKTMATVPYPFNIPLAAAQLAAGLAQVSQISSQTVPFAKGGSFVVDQPTTLPMANGQTALVGEAGAERIDVTPLSGGRRGGGQGGVTVNVYLDKKKNGKAAQEYLKDVKVGIN
jgi:hypothetical protein